MKTYKEPVYEQGRTSYENSSELCIPMSRFKLTKCDGSISINGIEVKHIPSAGELVEYG